VTYRSVVPFCTVILTPTVCGRGRGVRTFDHFLSSCNRKRQRKRTCERSTRPSRRPERLPATERNSWPCAPCAICVSLTHTHRSRSTCGRLEVRKPRRIRGYCSPRSALSPRDRNRDRGYTYYSEGLAFTYYYCCYRVTRDRQPVGIEQTCHLLSSRLPTRCEREAGSTADRG